MDSILLEGLLDLHKAACTLNSHQSPDDDFEGLSNPQATIV
jgi:hypothetical protein